MNNQNLTLSWHRSRCRPHVVTSVVLRALHLCERRSCVAVARLVRGLGTKEVIA